MLLGLVLAACGGPAVPLGPDPGPGELRLVVPRRQIAAGAVVNAEDLQVIRIHRDFVPQSGVVKDPNQLVGRRTTGTLLKHEFVRQERLGPPLAGAAADPAYGAPAPGAAPPEDTVMVIVSARQLDAGRIITEDDLYAVKIPPRYLPNEVFLSPEHVVGRTVCDTILQNELVRVSRLEIPDRPCLAE